MSDAVKALEDIRALIVKVNKVHCDNYVELARQISELAKVVAALAKGRE